MITRNARIVGRGEERERDKERHGSVAKEGRKTEKKNGKRLRDGRRRYHRKHDKYVEEKGRKGDALKGQRG